MLRDVEPPKSSVQEAPFGVIVRPSPSTSTAWRFLYQLSVTPDLAVVA